MRVLLLEDEPVQATALTYILRKRGYDVAMALSVADAMAFLDEMNIDAAVLDFLVPDARGSEAGQLLKARGIPYKYYSVSSHAPQPLVMKPDIDGILDWLESLAVTMGETRR